MSDMRFIADLHIHSKYSRATSRDLDPEHLSLWAQNKGIRVVGTGDFTHPAWLSELKNKLTEADSGLYRLRPDLEQAVGRMVPPACQSRVLFMVTGEISCIYKKDGKTRKVHHLILMPDFDAADRLNQKLQDIGNITSDGRPILGLDSRDLLELVLETDERAFFIPAHIWTPWFSLFGSKSGFDALEECFGDLSGYIHALETGLSSDPPMNRLLSALDPYLLVSNSDAHSAAKLGREANLFDCDLDFASMAKAMATGQGFRGTIEFFPEEGKYHLDGHRKCGVRLDPFETRQYHGLCPECGKPLTVGVLHRVYELADRRDPLLKRDFVSLIPLPEILSEILQCGPTTKKVTNAHLDLLNNLGPELYILMEAPLDSIEKCGGGLLREAIERMREGKVLREAGFDGEYGRIRLFEHHELAALMGQATLFEVKKPDIKDIPEKRSKDDLIKESSIVGVKGASEAAKNIDPILGVLNDKQREAVLFRKGHLLVKAGPGTGKTRTLTHRIAYLLREGIAKANQILALTFTRKAAEEMRSRLEALVGRNMAHILSISTFHGLCLELLKCEKENSNLPQPLTLLSEVDSIRLCNKILSQSAGKMPSLTRFRRALYMHKLGTVKGRSSEMEGIAKDLLEQYQTYLKEHGLLDLDDLEVEAFKLLARRQDVARRYGLVYKWIFVDEYQDTNPVQASMVKMLVEAGEGSLFAIGDPDQAIYSFRGADVRCFHRFLEDFPGATMLSLEEVYRCTQKILDASASVLGSHKALVSHVGEGDKVLLSPCTTETEEAEMIVESIERLIGGVSYFSLDSGRVGSSEEGGGLSFRDFAILYRLNSQAAAIKEALARRGIPFFVSGEKPLVEYFPVNVIWRFFQLIASPDNPYYREAYEELITERKIKCPIDIDGAQYKSDHPGEIVKWAIENHHLEDIPEDGQQALRRFVGFAQDWEGGMQDFLEMVSLERGIDHGLLLGDRVSLMTLHSAKGLEWPVVFITGCEQGLIPCTIFRSTNEDEERRLLYVGMTRAQRILIISWAKRRNLNGRLISAGPSSFLDNMPDEIKSSLERSGWTPRPKAHKQLRLF